jgi:hypothetical protein
MENWEWRIGNGELGMENYDMLFCSKLYTRGVIIILNSQLSILH